MGGRGRGRGRGASSSFSREQLNSMGFSASETLPSVVTQPPPLYPPLERKAVPLTVSSSRNIKNYTKNYVLMALKQFFSIAAVKNDFYESKQRFGHTKRILMFCKSHDASMMSKTTYV